VGKGTTFSVFLPILRQPAEAAAPARTVIQATRTERLLFVDDEAGIARMQQAALERLGYKVTVRTSSVDALEMFKADPAAFDLVITDMAMPNMTGEQLARQLLRIRPDLPIVICTGFSERIDAQRAKAIGIKGFVMKPMLINELAAEIRRVLDG
jgi:CheY-like chemotaxis protein